MEYLLADTYDALTILEYLGPCQCLFIIDYGLKAQQDVLRFMSFYCSLRRSVREYNVTTLARYSQYSTLLCVTLVPKPPPPSRNLPHASQLLVFPPLALRVMDNAFIEALVQACTCSRHFPRPQYSLSSTFFTYHTPRRKAPDCLTQDARTFHSSTYLATTQPARFNISREEYRRMVDYYREPYTTQASGVRSELSGLTLPLPSLESNEIKPRNFGPDELEEVDGDTASEDPMESADADDQVNAEKGTCSSKDLVHGIKSLRRVLKNQTASHEDILDAYSTLPFPGVKFLKKSIRRKLLNRLSVVETKSQKSMMRFLSVIDDMKVADLPIAEAEWNSAIAFTGRCFTRVTAVEVESALRVWKEMEQEAGVQSGKVTFSILFDTATRAGKFVLAEMILQEMANRRLPLNRFAQTGIIYYHGLKGDGQGVRKAYQALVDAGHIVDVVVMDCVVASLLRAGEAPAAEQVYERMKRMSARKAGVTYPLPTWRQTRELGRVLEKGACMFKKDPQKRQQLQDEQWLGPDLRTFTILIGYHIAVTGELRRAIRLLDDMQSLGIPMHGTIFLRIFKGFALNGGIRYTSWTKARLESVWNALRLALDDRVPDVQLQKWMVVWIMRAFAKCCGRVRALEIWAEIKTRWKPDTAENDTVHHILREILDSTCDFNQDLMRWSEKR